MNTQINPDDLISPLFSILDLKAKSLLVTVWGDCVAPHGGTIWLGSLISLVDSLGLSERVVRTAVFRLQKEGLLSSQQIGRRSFYSLTKSGENRFAEATHRIYAEGGVPWNGEWLLLFAIRHELKDKDRRKLEMELGWLGFGDLGSGIYAHPTMTAQNVEPLLRDLNLAGKITTLTATRINQSAFGTPEILIQKGWNLKDIEKDYARFIHNFSKLTKLGTQAAKLDEKKCFIIRSLLVHDYRRVLLRDPMLPAELLPDGWNGNQARSLFQEIYGKVWEGAEEHLMSVLESTSGRLPPASEEFSARFGGLKR